METRGASENEADGLWKNRAFAKLFSAHAISLLGTSLTSIALGLLAHELVGAGVAAVMGITLAIRIAVIVFLSPFAGYASDRLGAKPTMLLADICRAVIVLGFLLVTAVWQIYLLAFLLNLASSLFTPVYKACIPNIVTSGQYPRALAHGAVAYDAASSAGPVLAGLLIVWVGFHGNFVANAGAFLISAGLILSVHLVRPPEIAKDHRSARLHGIRAMLLRAGLVKSLFFSARVAVISGFVLVATIHYVKNTLGLGDSYYAWAMTAHSLGSVTGALLYGQMTHPVWRARLRAAAPWCVPAALLLVAGTHSFGWLAAAWLLAGAGQVILLIQGNELLAANSRPDERSHIYAAHFSLSHIGWGVTYPLAGWWTTAFGFNHAALMFAGLYLLVAVAEPLAARCHANRGGAGGRGKNKPG